jgi:hypothetical protein
MLSLRRWRPRHLLLGWSVYWVGLILIGLGPGLAAAWRATRPGRHGKISAGVDDGVVNASVTAEEISLWSGAADLSTVLLLLAGPPVLLWLVWLVTRPQRGTPTRTPQ